MDTKITRKTDQKFVGVQTKSTGGSKNERGQNANRLAVAAPETRVQLPASDYFNQDSFSMTQTASPIAGNRNPEPLDSDSAREDTNLGRLTTQPRHAEQAARAVLHLPTRMRGVYRQAPSLKGA